MSRFKLFILTGLAAAATLVVIGCGNKGVYPLESKFRQIEVGATDSTEVMNLLPEEGMLHTTNSVSVFQDIGWSKEAGIVTFNEQDSQVLRKIYLQRQSNINAERIFLHIQFRAPEDILNEPYETRMRKSMALLQHAHDAMVEDIRSFTDDAGTESILGLARSALSMAIIHLNQSPREVHTLMEKDGFYFNHSTMNDSHIKLKQNSDEIYSIAIRTHAKVDPLVGW